MKTRSTGFNKTPELAKAQRPPRSGEIRFFTVEEVASFFAVSLRSVRRWVDKKKLAAHHFGSAVRIAESDLRAFIAMHRDI